MVKSTSHKIVEGLTCKKPLVLASGKVIMSYFFIEILLALLKANMPNSNGNEIHNKDNNFQWTSEHLKDIWLSLTQRATS